MIGQPPPPVLGQSAAPPAPVQKPKQEVTGPDGVIHVFPAEATPEMIAQIMGVKPPSATPAPVVGGPPPPIDPTTLTAGGGANINLTPPSRVDLETAAGRVQTLGRQTLDFTTKTAMPAVGATIGGTLGFTRGGLPGEIVGTMAGQAAGDVAGMQVESMTGGTGYTKDRMLDVPTQALIAGGTAGVTSPVMRGLSAATRFLFSPTQTIATTARETMKPGMTEATRFVEGQVMPHEVSSSPMLKILGNIIEGAPATQADYQGFLAKRRGLFLKKAEELITAPGPRADRQGAGEVIRDAKIGQAAQKYGDLTTAAGERGQETIDAAGARAHEILQTGMTDAARLKADAEATRSAAQSAYDRAVSESSGRWGDFGDTVGPSMGREPMGERTLTLLTAAHEAAAKEASTVYNRVWDATKGERLSLDPLIQRATALRREIGGVPGETGVAGRANRAAGIAEAAAGDVDGIAKLSGRADVERITAAMDPSDPRRLGMLNDLAEVEQLLKGSEDGTLTPQQVHSLKSYYGRMGFAESGGRSFEKGVFKQLWQAAENTLKQLPEDTYNTIKTADALHQSMIEDFETGALEMLAKKEPKDVLQMVMSQVRTGGASNVKKLLEKIGPEGTQSVRAEVWNALSTHPDGTPKTPAQFLKAVTQLPDDAVKALFGGQADNLPALKAALEGTETAAAGLKPAAKAAAGLESQAGARVDEATSTADALLAGATKDATKATAAVTTRAEKELARLHALPTENLVAASLKNADVTGAAKLRTLVGEEGWKKVQSVDLQRLFGRYEESAGAPLLTPKSLTDALNARGEEAFVAAHSQGEWNALQVFARSWEKLFKGEPGSAAKMAIQMKTPGAIGSIAGTGALWLTGGDLTTSATVGLGTAGAVLLGPKMLARIFQSPKMRAELLKGVTAKVRRDQPVVTRAALQLVRQLAGEGLLQSSGAPGNQVVQTADTPGTGRSGGPGPNVGGRAPGGRAGGPPPALTTPQQSQGGPNVPRGTSLPNVLEQAGVLPEGAAKLMVGQPPPPVKKQ